MTARYIAFDVETPNYNNDRISAIGITIADDNAIIQRFSTLVNPEAHFDDFNIALTGITPRAVADQPTFDQLWPAIQPLLTAGILAAHNAAFDLRVLSFCLRDYEVDWQPQVDYLCTCTLGRICYPDLPDHRLNTLCQARNIPLRHHDAGDDSQACAALLLDYIAQGLKPDEHLRQYDLLRTCVVPRKRKKKAST